MAPLTEATDWADDGDVSARSLLVTIFGDSILPVATSVWLSQLFRLTEPFGFSQRLIRTSLFRLAADNWVTSERVGRQSRYSLTATAVRESADADRRIYLSKDRDWDGTWTLVMTDATVAATEDRQATDDRDATVKQLRWHGFVPLGRGVLASPTTDPKAVTQLLDDHGLAAPVMAVGHLHDLEHLVDQDLFTSAFDMVDVNAAYAEFLDRYRPMARRRTSTSPEPRAAYAARTMLIHDLRRIRLREPELPRTLLPPDWIGHDAHRLAGELYATLSPPAAAALETILERPYPATMPHRFPA